MHETCDMTKPSDERPESLRARLARALTKRKDPAGPPPSYDELLALADGNLSAARRAQVIAHLANDRHCYRRWVALGDALAAADKPAAAPPVTRLSPLRRLLDGLTRPAAAGALAAALAVAVAAPLSPSWFEPDYSRAIDRLYEDTPPRATRGLGGFSNLYNALPPSAAALADPPLSLPTRGLSLSAPALERSTTRQLMEAGARAGLVALPGLSLPGLPFSRLSPLPMYKRVGLLRPSWRARYELGRLTALTGWQCRSGPPRADYAPILAQYTALRRALGGDYAEQPALKPLLAALDLAGDARYRVCTAARRGLEFLAAPPS